jgi:hypothetical protein
VKQGGIIYGVPESILLSTFGWCEDAWQAAGLGNTAPPASYVELLDFLEMWVTRIQKAPEPGIRVNSMFDVSLYNKRSYVKNLLPVLMDFYTLPALREGRRVQFDALEFRTLLERTVNIGEALYAAEPQASEGDLQLFENGLEGFGIIASKDGYSHAMPLRIRADQPVLYKASLTILCVGADCGQAAISTAYLEHMISHLQPYAATYAYIDSLPLMRENLAQDTADQKKRMDMTASQLKQGDLSKVRRQELEAQLRRQSQVLESMQTEGWKYLISPEWLCEYKSIAADLFFPWSSPLVMFSSHCRAMRELVRAFSEEKTSADQFITALDALD